MKNTDQMNKNVVIFSIFIFLIGSFFYLSNLDSFYLWQDEANAALLAKNILQRALACPRLVSAHFPTKFQISKHSNSLSNCKFGGDIRGALSLVDKRKNWKFRISRDFPYEHLNSPKVLPIERNIFWDRKFCLNLTQIVTFDHSPVNENPFEMKLSILELF